MPPEKRAWFDSDAQLTETNEGRNLLVGALEEWLADDALVFLEDLELDVGLGFTNVDVLGKVAVLLGGHLAARTVEGEA